MTRWATLATFADQAGFACNTPRTGTRRGRWTCSRRDRIAQDLHEHVIARLFGIGLALHGTQRLAKSPTLAARIAEHIEQLNEVIADVRTAVFDLHTDRRDSTARRCADHHRRGPDRRHRPAHHGHGRRPDRHPARDTRRTRPSGAPGGGQQRRPARRRHRGHRDRHRRSADLVLVEVTDNGVGIPGTVARSGLHNLSTRARVFGGTLTVDRPAGGGTHLAWTAPLP